MEVVVAYCKAVLYPSTVTEKNRSNLRIVGVSGKIRKRIISENCPLQGFYAASSGIPRILEL